MRKPPFEVESLVSYPSPNWDDEIVRRDVDMDLPKNKEFEYGDPHPDSGEYPNHVLVYVSTQKGSKDAQWFYAKTRVDQDEYNYSYLQVDLGGRKFDTVVRNYIKLRTDFDESTLQAGTAMPADPDDAFLNKGYVLMTRQNVPSSDQIIASLFVTEEQVFIKKVTITSIGFDEFSGYQLYEQMEWFYRGEVVTGSTTIEDLLATPGHPYWDLQITPYPSYYNGFILDTVLAATDGLYIRVATQRNGKDQYTDDGNVVDGSTLRSVYWNSGTNRWIINSVAGAVETPLYYSEDDVDNPAYATTWKLVADNSVQTVTFSYQTAQLGAGVTRECQQLSDDWFVVSEKAVIAGAINGNGLDVQSYGTTISYRWPPVLSRLSFLVWARHDGGQDVYPDYDFEPEGYNGPCKALVMRGWSPDPFAITGPDVLNPLPIQYSCPAFSVNIPACLHDEFFLECDYGTADPIYTQNVNSDKTFLETDDLVWPSSLIASDEQEPFRGGYMRTIVTVYKPF